MCRLGTTSEDQAFHHLPVIIYAPGSLCCLLTPHLVTVLNRLPEAFKQYVTSLLTDYKPVTCSNKVCVLDSLSIHVCSGKRTGKVAHEISDKGYYSTKSMHYFDWIFTPWHLSIVKNCPFLSNFLLPLFLNMIYFQTRSNER